MIQNIIGTLCLVILIVSNAPAGQIHRQIWDNSYTKDLTGAISWINFRSSSSNDLLNTFEFPNGSGKNAYVVKVWGWLTPSVTGDYTFWIASDDDSGLWISDSANPIVPTVGSEICRVSKWTGYRN